MMGISTVQNRKTVLGAGRNGDYIKLYTSTGEKYLKVAIKDQLISFSEQSYHSLIVILKDITVFTNLTYKEFDFRFYCIRCVCRHVCYKNTKVGI